MSRWWVMELDAEHGTDAELADRQHPTTRGGIYAGVTGINGVRPTVTDLDAMSFDTLQELLLPSDPELVRKWRREKARTLREQQRTSETNHVA